MNQYESLEERIAASKLAKAGSDDYRAFVGPPAQFDFMGATQFALLYMLGIREEHNVLDVGCGSLRAGRLLIPFLLPGRYHGSDPNQRIVEEYIDSEIGKEIIQKRQPKFYFTDSTRYAEIREDFDFIVAQSVLSHTGGDMIDGFIEGASNALGANGQFLFTVLDETAPNYDRLARGPEAPGWHYPTCVTYRSSDILARCERHGLVAQKLGWFHPRQSWYRAVNDRTQLLSPGDIALTGTGRPLFDDRFKS